MQDDLWAKLFTTLLYNKSFIVVIYESCTWVSDHEFPFHPTNTGTQTIEHTSKQKRNTWILSCTVAKVHRYKYAHLPLHITKAPKHLNISKCDLKEWVYSRLQTKWWRGFVWYFYVPFYVPCGVKTERNWKSEI